MASRTRRVPSATRHVARPAAVEPHDVYDRAAFCNAAASASVHFFGMVRVTFSAALVSLVLVVGSVGGVPRHTVAGSPASLPLWIPSRHFWMLPKVFFV